MRKLLIVAAAMLLPTLAPLHKPPNREPKSNPLPSLRPAWEICIASSFPRLRPLGTANFIGLATGTKDWTNPKTGKKEHGVPLYDNTIFHRVIPEFMIQGGDPAGTGSGQIGLPVQE